MVGTILLIYRVEEGEGRRGRGGEEGRGVYTSFRFHKLVHLKSGMQLNPSPSP
jgi:hypothetical protein